MAMDHVSGMSHTVPTAPRPQSQPTVAEPSAPPTNRRMPADTFQSSRLAQPMPADHDQGAHTAQPTTASETASGEKLMGVANLGRLPHLFHFLAPLGNFFKGAGSKVASSVEHMHHGMDMAKAATGGFVARLGGPLSVIATGLSAVIAVMDIRNAAKVLKDGKATSSQKNLAVTQAALSGASGVTGLLAAGAALGLALPFSIPVLLGVSTVTGLASFAVSLFNRHAGHQGH